MDARRQASPDQPLGAARPLGRDFYLRSAVESATDFLGKVLVHDTPDGRLAGVITDVEAYPAFVDEVHHGNKRTPRTRIMWGPGGRAYIYRIYGIWHQVAAVVNEADVPDVVLLRGTVPIAGIDAMKAQWDTPRASRHLTDSPGKLCRSFAITTGLYGADLTESELRIEDWQLTVPAASVRTSARVGISPRRVGHDAQLRFYIRAADLGRPSALAVPSPASSSGTTCWTESRGLTAGTNGKARAGDGKQLGNRRAEIGAARGGGHAADPAQRRPGHDGHVL